MPETESRQLTCHWVFRSGLIPEQLMAPVVVGQGCPL